MTAMCPACDVAEFASEVAETTAEVTLSVPQIKCVACIGSIERALSTTPGVRSSRVNLTQKRVSIATTRSAEDLIHVLNTIGFEAFAFDPTSLTTGTDPVGKDLLLRVGVAGFAMMNVMLLSVAVWSGATDATRDMFHLISAAIATPAALYAGQPFFRSAAVALRKGRLNMDVPISLAIILACGMSIFEALNGGEHAYFDATLSLTCFLLIGRLLEHKTRATARSAARDLAAMEAHTAQRLKDGRANTVAVTELTIGDEILVPSGTRVPVDGRLIDGSATTDQSFLSGESEPIEHNRNGLLQAGEINVAAPFVMVATAVGQDTRLHQLARLVETAETVRNRYTSIADRVAGYYAPIVHLLAAVTFIGWWIASGDPRHALNIAIAVLIITCPCALGLAVPAVSTAAIGGLYRLGFLVKSSTALERLASVDEVLLDKTGTLTRTGFIFDVSNLSEAQRSVAKALAQASSHPVSRALDGHLEHVTPAVLSDVKECTGHGMSAMWGDLPVFLGKHSAGVVLQIESQTEPLLYRETEKKGAANLAREFQNMKLDVLILSGDSVQKTKALSDRLGFDKWTAAASPEGKHQIVEQLHDKGRKPCMIGDGINDAAALQSAHASVAPGTALDAARSAADVIMLGDDLSDLPKLFNVARKAVRLYRQNFAIAFVYNATAIPIAVAGFATPLMAALAMSTSSIIVLLNASRARRVP